MRDNLFVDWAAVQHIQAAGTAGNHRTGVDTTFDFVVGHLIVVVVQLETLTAAVVVAEADLWLVVVVHIAVGTVAVG